MNFDADHLHDRRSLLRAAAFGAAGLAVGPGLTGIGDRAEAARRRTTRGAAATTTTPPSSTEVLRIGAPGFGPFGEDTGTPNTLNTLTTLSGLVTEHLVGVDLEFGLRPQLATEWRSNETATVWNFTIRTGVRFHNGQPATAEAIAKSFQTSLAADAAGQLTGVVTAAGVRAIKPNIVRFTLQFPFGLFPYLVSSDNPASAIINVQNGAGAGEWLGGTGPFVAQTPKSGATLPTPLLLERNAKYWRPLPKQYGFQSAQIFGYGSEDEAVALFTNNTVDLLTKVDAGSVAKFGPGGELLVNRAKSTEHYQIHMRTDTGAFADRRVRQAMQLTLDRGPNVDAGGNSPLAQFLPFVGPVETVPKNLILAKQLLRDAKKRNGFTASIASGTDPEALQLVRALIDAAAQIGVVLQSSATEDYLENQWLASDIGVTKFAHRATPGPVLAATIGSDGAWNAAHYKDAAVDALIRTVNTSRDITVLKGATSALGVKLAQSVPVIVPVFLSRTWVARKQSFVALGVSPHGQISFNQ
jgi:peptide/nickel transport system substrate-binding protein